MTGTEEMPQNVRAHHRVSRRNLMAQAQAPAEPTPPGLTRPDPRPIGNRLRP